MTEIYAAINKNTDELLHSSSGGVFSILAEVVLENGGVVWGAAFDKEWHVVHKRITSKEWLNDLRGSKYVYSKLTKDNLSSIKEDLSAGKIVLFCGTPCQVVIVIKYVGVELRKHLLAIDFTCHGTPLPEVWDTYLKELQQKGSITSINMRDKRFGWKTYSLRVDYIDGKVLSEIFTWNHYSQAFLKDVSLRKPCYKCPYKGIKPESDLTLADFWDVRTKHPEINAVQGVSKVYVHSEIGRKYFKACLPYITAIKDDVISDFKTPGGKIIEPSSRSLFLKTMKEKGFEAAYKVAVYKGILWSIKMKVKGLLKILMYKKNNNIL